LTTIFQERFPEVNEVYPDNSQSSHSTPALLGILLISLLFWEWLRPLLVLTETYTIAPFMLFFVFILLINSLRTPRWAKIPLGILLLGFIIHSNFFHTPFFSREWLIYIYEQTIHSISLLFARDFYDHSSVILTIAFSLLVWVAASYLYTVVIGRGKGLRFFIATVLLLGILDTFSPYNAALAIFRTVIIGFCLLTLIHFAKVVMETRRGQTGEEFSFPYQWVVLSMIVVTSFSFGAYLAPKAGPSWPDPVSFLQGYHQSLQGGQGIGIQRVGYGTNDERLGGPFVQDDQVVFIAESEQRHYWRGESKDTYTGKGWIQTEQEEELIPSDGTGIHSLNGRLGLFEGSGLEVIESNVRFVNHFSQAFMPGDPIDVQFFPNSPMARVVPSAGLVQAWQNEDPVSLFGYNVYSHYPTFSTKALLEADLTSENSPIPTHLRSQYTQLPESLPERVAELAREVVEGSESDYEKVRRVERFFRMNGYEYDTENVPFPAEDEDYVDQFLFETMIGYCDNFSTAMVVMLRAVDIPARWVKGFTFGETVQSDDDQRMRTRVKNLHAHSWVEVYFPDIGWVPFEPTSTFSNPYTFERDDIERDSANGSTSDPDLLLEELDGPFADIDDFLFEHDQNWAGGGANQSSSWTKIALLTGLIILSVLGFVLIFRKQLILAWALVKYQEANEKSMLGVYEWLIRYFGRYVRKREPHETLREYIIALEQKAESEELVNFTRYYEDMRYNAQVKKGQPEQAHELWKRLMKKLQSPRS
jgi:transglutaminase-like putative cysteine protease